MRQVEIAIVGAGPGGLGAALEAADAGAEVVLIDEYPTLGGQFYKQVPDAFQVKRLDGESEQYVEGAELVQRVKAARIEVLPSSLVWSIFRDGTLGLYREGRTEELRGKKLILAPGAQEAPVAFPGWTLPGVMMGGAAQSLLVTHRVLPGRRVVMAGVGPLQLKVAYQLLEAGATIVDILEASGTPPVSVENALRSLGHWGKMREGMKYWMGLKQARTPYHDRHVPVRALGGEQLEAVVVAEVNDEWRVVPGTERTLPADTLCLSYGFVPSIQLTRLLGCRIAHDGRAGGWLTWHDDDQQTSFPGVYVAGEVGGIGGADVAIEEGRIAGLAAARALGKTAPKGRQKQEQAARRRLAKARQFAGVAAGMMQLRPALIDLATDDTILCRCENVTARQVREAIGFEDDSTLRGVKIHTRAGMGPCQGRMCSVLISRVIARKTGAPLESIQPDTAQAPIKPIPLRALVAHVQ
ncbi:MAG TPA: NAD(P)/FAD-dependent oxidoreductase [Candidatus Methylomirabilis sp.]|nr:NAD(P)/FAD-dependent oxidoreductase [Candidatus Methylomirabilis sp.]